jgi:hypothetical protein
LNLFFILRDPEGGPEGGPDEGGTAFVPSPQLWKAIVDKSSREIFFWSRIFLYCREYFYTVENIFIQSRLFFYRQDYFFTVENFFLQSRLFFALEIFCSREIFFIVQNIFTLENIFCSREFLRPKFSPHL